MLGRTMAYCGGALALSSCGYVGIELRDGPPGDGGMIVEGDASLHDAAADARADLDASRDGSPVESDADAADGAVSGDAALADGALPDGALPDGSVLDGAVADAGVPCDLTGSWAVKVTTQVSWPGSFIEASGGTASTWLLYQGTQSGGTWSGTSTVCGFLLPDFRLNPLVFAETYAVRVPDTLFDRTPPYITPIAAALSFGGVSVPGATVVVGPQAYVIGATLANPASDAWPDNATLTQVDTDVDTQPGVTANYLSDATHVYPPLDLTRTQRADRSYFAVRLAYNGSGSITSCNELNGAVSFSHFDTHILGCHIAGGGACSNTLTEFLDDNRPLYTPGASTFRALKVAPNTTCSQIRTTLPP